MARSSHSSIASKQLSYVNRFAKEVEACKAMSSKTLFRKRLALLLNKNRELCCAMLARGFRKLTVDSGFEEMKGDLGCTLGVRHEVKGVVPFAEKSLYGTVGC